MLEVGNVLTNELVLVGPSISPVAMHFVIDPLACRFLSIAPLVCARAVHHVVHNFAIKNRPICHAELSMPTLEASLELTLVSRPVWHDFGALPALLSVDPLAIVFCT